MFHVKNSNILQILPIIKQEISESVIISLDAEYSGIGSRVNILDSIEERYIKLKKVISDYTILQIGITIFKPDKKIINKYISSTYLFYLTTNLNSLIIDDSSNLNFKLSALQFLVANGFNLSKWADSGLIFARNDIRENLEAHFDDYLSLLCSDLNRELEKDFVFIVSWLSDYKRSKDILGENYLKQKDLQLLYKVSNNEIFNYYYLYKIRQFLLDKCNTSSYLNDEEIVWCDCNGNKFMVYFVPYKICNQLSNETQHRNRFKLAYIHDVKTLHSIMKQDKEYFLNKIFALSNIFEWISKSKALIVGHNFLMDLLFIYENFFFQLPDNFGEFKKKIHEVFPLIYDTKLIAQHERILNVRYHCLVECYLSLCRSSQTFSNCVPDICIRMFQNLDMSEYDHYQNALNYKRLNGLQAHNAGFDSFITGFIFIYSGYILMKQSKMSNGKNRVKRKTFFDFRMFLTDKIRHYCNSLYISANFNHPLSLVSQSNKTRLIEKYLIKFSNETSKDLFLALNNKLQYVDYKQISSKQFIVASTYSPKQKLFMQTLVDLLHHHQSGSATILDYALHQKYSTIRKTAWLTFFSSAACFVLLFSRFCSI